MPKIDVEALWEQSGHWLTDYTAAVIEECAKVCDDEVPSEFAWPERTRPRTADECAAAIRALKP